MTQYRYDTQLLIEGTDLDEDAINNYFVTISKGAACRQRKPACPQP